MALRPLAAGVLFLAGPAFGAPAPIDLATARKTVGAMSVPFVANAGQWDPAAAFAAKTFAGTLFVTTAGQLVYSLSSDAVSARNEAGPRRVRPEEQPARRREQRVLTETLVDGNSHALPAVPKGIETQGGTVSYAIGNDARTHLDGVSAFGRVDLGHVYAGIGVQLRATGSNVEKIFTVDAGSDPSAIGVRLDGAERLHLGAGGELVAQVGTGAVTYTAPFAYQEDDAGNRQPVSVRYVLAENTNRYGFAVGAYDESRPLVIDPLLRSTFVGGSSEDQITALAIHPASGEVYVTGFTKSAVFPKITDGVFTSPLEQASIAAGYDVFVTRLDAALTTRLQSIYFGGSDDDYANAIAIHPRTGDVYVAGGTLSSDLPARAGGAQGAIATPKAGGSRFDGFVVQLDAALTKRKQSTYVGGDDLDTVTAMAVHPLDGSLYLTGYTASRNNFPGTSAINGPYGYLAYDAFVLHVSADLKSFQQIAFNGYLNNDHSNAIAIHPVTGHVYIAGQTFSTTIPGTAGSEQPALSGPSDAFVSWFSPYLTLQRTTYLGGSNGEAARGLAVHPINGDIYVTGATSSSQFPKTSLAPVPTNPNDSSFVARLTPYLNTIVTASYVGGGGDSTYAMVIHPVTGDVFVAGATTSLVLSRANGGAQPTKAGPIQSYDAFITKFNAHLTTIYQATYFGGIADEQINAVALHPSNGYLYFAGNSQSPAIPSPNGEQATGAGGIDGFVAAISTDLSAIDATPNSFVFPPKLNVPPGSPQTSGPVAITGLDAGLVNISITGGNFARYCWGPNVNNCQTCPSYISTPSYIINGDSVCVRQIAPDFTPASANATLSIGSGWANFLVSTGTDLIGCTLDVDGNGSISALTDGLVLMRAMFGLTGTDVTKGAIGPTPTRSTWPEIRAYLNGNCGGSFSQ